VAKRYQFAGFTLDVTAGTLARPPEPIHLSPKVFQLLVFLVERAGVLVTKEEMLDAVWAGTNVAEGSVNRAIATLRAALGDDPDAPRVIETVPWRGYRFIAPLQTRDPLALRPVVVHRDVEHALKVGENLLGRDSDCDITIPYGSVSRHHARIRVTTSGVTIIDLGSKNGTFVRDARIYSETDLRHGDEIRLGQEQLRIFFASASTISVEVPAAY
jgi:DNA-binding winged helix-turn-helix (wHTH) protein